MPADQLCLFCADECGCEKADNVIRITGEPFAGDMDAVSEDAEFAASQLEELANTIRQGQLRGFAIVLGSPEIGTDIIVNVATVTSNEVVLQPMVFLAGLDRLKHRINSQIDYEIEEQLEAEYED